MEATLAITNSLGCFIEYQPGTEVLNFECYRSPQYFFDSPISLCATGHGTAECDSTQISFSKNQLIHKTLHALWSVVLDRFQL